jgi:hypothetical protein
MARPHKVLRDLLHEHEITGEILARELRLGTATISRKLNGHSPFDQDEMWHIMSLIEQPAYRLHEIFPRKGANEARKGA